MPARATAASSRGAISGARGAPVPALERGAAVVLGHEQHVAAPVHARAPRLGTSAELAPRYGTRARRARDLGSRAGQRAAPRSIHGAQLAHGLVRRRARARGAAASTCTAPSLSTLTRTRRARGERRRLYSVTSCHDDRHGGLDRAAAPAVREPYEVYINGVRQEPGNDYGCAAAC